MYIKYFAIMYKLWLPNGRIEVGFDAWAGPGIKTIPFSRYPPERAREQMDGTLDITEARTQLNRLDERLRDDRVIYVTRHNKKVFAVIDIEYLQTMLETIEIVSDPDSLKLFQQSLEDIRNGRVTDHEDLKKELGL